MTHDGSDPAPRPVQYFDDEYLERCRSTTGEQICRYLDDYRILVNTARAVVRPKTKAISLRVAEPLLRAFKTKARAQGLRYQTKIQARARALAARHLVERLCVDALDRFGRAVGPGPLAFDAAVARRHAELSLYVRQCHGERDLEALADLAPGG